MALQANAPTNYTDFLNRLQSFSSSRRAATGRGLTQSELQGMTSGYLDAENARKLDQFKTQATLATQRDIENRKAEIQEKQVNSQQQQALGQGLLSGLGSIGKGYLMNKYLSGTTPTAAATTGNLGTSVPSVTAPAYTSSTDAAALTSPTIGAGTSPVTGAVTGAETGVLSSAAPSTSGTGILSTAPTSAAATTSAVPGSTAAATTPISAGAPAQGILSSITPWLGPAGAGMAGGSLGGMALQQADVMGKNEANIGGGVAGGAAAGAAAGAPVAGVGAVPGAVVGGIVGGLEGLYESGFFDDLFG